MADKCCSCSCGCHTINPEAVSYVTDYLDREDAHLIVHFIGGGQLKLHGDEAKAAKEALCCCDEEAKV